MAKNEIKIVEYSTEEQAAIDKAMSPLTEVELADLDSFNELAPELTVAELQQEIFNVKFRYDSLLNYLKPLLSHDALVLLAEKKKEIFA